MPRKTREQEKPESEDRWLITYADMVTLLMVFFVVMYAIAEVKATKLAPISYALQKNFYPENVSTVNSNNQELKINGSAAKEGGENSQKISELIKDVGNVLIKKLEKQDLGKAVNIEIKKEELTVSLNTGKGFFELGSADVKPATAKILDTIAELCRELPDGAFIRVEGYTCDLPISSGVYPSNWELSTARATQVAKYLIEKGKLNPTRFSAAGYGQYRPKLPNTSEANRAMNRRVEITIDLKGIKIENSNITKKAFDGNKIEKLIDKKTEEDTIEQVRV